jgi:hypothetical protein
MKGCLNEGCCGGSTWLVGSFLVATQLRLNIHLDAVASPQKHLSLDRHHFDEVELGSLLA